MIDKFTFYKNYYDIINYLPDEQRLALYDSISKYMFEDKEPELQGLLNGIWVNIKMPLDTSKKNIKNGQNGGRPINPTNNPEKTQTITQMKPKSEPKAKANNISYFLFLINNNKYKYININNYLYKKIEEWLNYKQERKEIYKQTGLQSLLTQIDKQTDIYGEEAIIELINECMASNYKGIIFDKLKNKFKRTEKPLPEWFGKEIEEEVNKDAEEFAKRVRGED